MIVNDIIDALNRYKQAQAQYSEASEVSRDIDLDIRIAKRDANGEAQAKLERQKAEHVNKVWYPAYIANKNAVDSLCKALGVSAEELKAAL